MFVKYISTNVRQEMILLIGVLQISIEAVKCRGQLDQVFFFPSFPRPLGFLLVKTVQFLTHVAHFDEILQFLGIFGSVSVRLVPVFGFQGNGDEIRPFLGYSS